MRVKYEQYGWTSREEVEITQGTKTLVQDRIGWQQEVIFVTQIKEGA